MSRWDDTAEPRGADYDERWARLEAAGHGIHGEADLLEALLAEGAASRGAGSVLDAGCGTGRVAVELARRGVEVVGVDLDRTMLDEARAKDPSIEWRLGDLVSLDLGRTFDIVAAPGNVMIFLAAGTEADVVSRLGVHARPGGLVVVGFQRLSGRLTVDHYDELAAAAGLDPVARWSTWDRGPHDGGDYAVTVHRRPPD